MTRARGHLPTKEHFCALLDGIRDKNDAAHDLDELMSKRREFAATRDFFSGYCLVANGTQEIIDLLAAVFDAKDELYSFCFEFDYGRTWHPGDFMVNGKDVDMSSSEALYDYLVQRLEN